MKCVNWNLKGFRVFFIGILIWMIKEMRVIKSIFRIIWWLLGRGVVVCKKGSLMNWFLMIVMSVKSNKVVMN